MPRCQPQLKSTERKSRAPGAGVYGGGPPRPRPPPCAPAPPPCCAGAGPAPPPACPLAVSGAPSVSAMPSAIVVRIIPCRDAITSLLSSAITAPSVGYKLDFFLVPQNNRAEETDG